MRLRTLVYGALCAILVCTALPSTADEAAPLKPMVSNVHAWAGPDNSLHVRWITAAPARCTVEYGPAGQFTASTFENSDVLRGTTNNRQSYQGWAENHRADIHDIQDYPLSVRIVGEYAGTDEKSAGTFISSPITVQAPTQPAAQHKSASIPIQLDAGDWQLPMLPYTVGIPFPPGTLASAQNVRVLLGRDELPSQAQVTSRWREDGSAKWLRLDFEAPSDATEVTLQYGGDIMPQPVISISPDTSLFSDAAVMDAQLTDSTGIVYSLEIEQSGVEERGPVKIVKRMSGHFASKDKARLFAFTIRQYLWESGIERIEFTMENDNTLQEMTGIRSLELFPSQAQSGALTVFTDAGDIPLAEGRLFQREDFEWVSEPEPFKGKRLPGVFTQGKATFVIRDFWQQWPASIETRQHRAVIGLCPRLPEGFYANRPDEDKLYYNLRDGLHTFRQGFSKTWQIWAADTDVPGISSITGEKPVASVPPQWIEDSRALGKLAIASRNQFAGFDEGLLQAIQRFPELRERAREYGMMNFGDWHGERRWNWGNLEYDMGHALLQQFCRTGNAVFFRRAEEAIRHQRDVDTRHYADDVRRIGQQWTHSIGHTGAYYPKEYKNMKIYASPGWSDNRGHIWCQGMLEHALLGGDLRSLETGMLIADWCAGPQTTNFTHGLAREPGWMLKLVMSAYMATDDPFYLNAARIMLDDVHEKSIATGDHGFYYHELYGGHCSCEPKHFGEAGFMLGTLTMGMKMYYEATGDKQVAEDIVKIARFTVDTMWDPSQQAFRYTSCPNTGATTSHAWIMMPGLAFAANYAHDEELAEICRTALTAAWGMQQIHGKGLELCNAAQALDEVAKLPGQDFASYRSELAALLYSPARRPLPSLIPNPDFETGPDGWPTRGWHAAITHEVAHSGDTALCISGTQSGQNEYLNTTYGTAGSPYEIRWLIPGAAYRMNVWLRVDSITPGTPAPTMRIQFRDNLGSRSSKATNAYDLSRPGTWQLLTTDFTVPDYNTRNYIALNTHSKSEITVEMYLDDISLVPAASAAGNAYAYYRMPPSAASFSGGAKSIMHSRLASEQRIAGPGSASWKIDVQTAGVYTLWAKTDGGSSVTAAINAQTTPSVKCDTPNWVMLWRGELPAGAATISIPSVPADATVSTLVLTNDPTSP